MLTASLGAFAGCSLKVDRSQLSALEDCDGGVCLDTAACNDPSCCPGCWDGVACVAGEAPAACGAGGGACRVCVSPTEACRQGQCVSPKALLALSAGGGHTCAADSQRDLWCWGNNAEGQLAVDRSALSAPEVVATGGWIDVAAAGQEPAHTCAIHFQGSLWCWGDNSRGQLGFPPEEVPRANRVRKVDDGGWAQVAAGPLATCAVRDEGTLWCWGAADQGRLGQGATMGSTRKPEIVGVEADWRQVAVGDGFACALKRDNTLYCWGQNDRGQLGRPGLQPLSARPVIVNANYLSVAAGAAHACGVRVGNSLWCWGENTSGQAGAPAAESFVTEPRRVSLPGEGQPLTWSAVVAGQSHTCALTTEGQIWCWGDNSVGQLGAPGALVRVEVPGGGPRRWVRVASGARHVCAEAADGTLWCWGDNREGQLGFMGSGPANVVLR